MRLLLPLLIGLGALAPVAAADQPRPSDRQVVGSVPHTRSHCSGNCNLVLVSTDEPDAAGRLREGDLLVVHDQRGHPMLLRVERIFDDMLACMALDKEPGCAHRQVPVGNPVWLTMVSPPAGWDAEFSPSG